MRAVVTGGAGFIGSHLVERLLAEDWDVLSIDDGRNGTPVGPSEGQLSVWNTAVETADVLVSLDAVFHLAAPVGPVGVLRRGGQITREVVETSSRVAAWAMRAGCPLIDVSTSEVYGSGGADSEDDPCTFAAPTSARKEYAVAKLAAETMLRNTAGLDVRIVRPFNVAGPRQSAYGGFVIPRFIQQARLGVPLTVYQPGSQQRSFTHVADIVDGLMLALERGEPGEVYNLGNPYNAMTIMRLAFLVREIVDTRATIETVDPTELWGPAFREAPDKIPVAEKAITELGWHPTRDIGQIIRDAAA